MKARIRSLGTNGPSAPAVRAFESQNCIFDVIEEPDANGFFMIVAPPNSLLDTWGCREKSCRHLGGGDWQILTNKEALDYI